MSAIEVTITPTPSDQICTHCGCTNTTSSTNKCYPTDYMVCLWCNCPCNGPHRKGKCTCKEQEA